MRKKFSAGHGRLFRLFRFLHSLETLGGIKKMRLNSFGSKFLAVAAVGLFLAACEKAPENAANTGGSGSSTMRSEEHTSELQSLMRISYAVFCLKKKIKHKEKLNINRPRHHIIHELQ